MFNKQKIFKYIEERHLKDGGYFFARVEPASGLDTFLAVRTLHALGLSPKHPELIFKFWETEDTAGNLRDITGLYFATQTLKMLDFPITAFVKYKDFLIKTYHRADFFQHKPVTLTGNTFGLTETGVASIYIDIIEGEAKSVYYLVKLLKDLHIPFDTHMALKYVKQIRNSDGGFGSMKGSQTATTMFCLKILNLIDNEPKNQSTTITFLQKELHFALYLEDYYYAIRSLILLREPILEKEKILIFLHEAYRGNGGFSRSQFIGISSIEYTYMAVAILKALHTI